MDQQRIPYWDNLKGILIVFVVAGHYLFEFREQRGIQEVLYAIYIFHMPAFLFISGYFSRSEKSTSLEALTRIMLWFLLLNFSMMFYAHYIDHKPFSLVNLYYSSWYLLALFLYRLTLPLCRKIPFIVAISFSLSLLIGFIWRIDTILGLQKIIALYPFFVAGAKLPTEKMERATSFLKKHQSAGWAVLVAIVFLSLWLILRHTITFREIIWDSYEQNADMGTRMTMLILASSAIGTLLAIAPLNRIPLVNQWGRNSLVIYLTHRIFTLLLVFFYPQLATDALGWLWLVFASFITLVVLGSDTVSRYFSGGMDRLVGAICSRGAPN
ncbi:MAG: acyltransferase family protein [Propionivibrio sp.]|uniref:acyltransferase family protein n=1 Tax=Propionivibrio sp. TaxID=2212460 RepID=UPI0025CBD586|nr:acyltransferase family protein [Propionivibrio sp.]MBK8894135.1 acyltransferase family protein [Propionivibrio sp.]